LAAVARFVAEQQDYRRIGVSTHSGVLRQFLKHALPEGPIPRIRNGAHHVMDYHHAEGRLVMVVES
jgi:broad specificity phosphatase PhoE